MAKKSLSLDSLITEPKAPESKAPEPAAETSAPKKAAYRIGKRAFTAWANIEAYRQLKHLATDRDTTIQALLEEGMDLVFEKYGYDQIARSKEGNTATQS